MAIIAIVKRSKDRRIY